MSARTASAGQRRGPAALILLARLVRQDFVERYAGSQLGLAWLVIWPVMQILVFTLVFAELIGPRLPGTEGIYAYGIYLVSGILPWTAFATTLARMTTVFLDKAALLTKVPLPLTLVAVHLAVVELVVLTVTLTLFMGFHLALAGLPPATALWVPLIMVFQQLIATAIGLLGALATVFIRDVKEAIGVITFLWFWLTPIVYLAADMPAIFAAIQPFNPAFWFIDQYHRAIVFGQAPDLAVMAGAGAGAVAAIAVMAALLRRWERDLRDLL